MKKYMFAIVAMFAAAPLLLIGEEKSSDVNKDAGMKQKTCPVSGKPIKEDKVVEYEGQKIYFCCGGCPGGFKANPVKYLPAYYKQVYPQAVQTKCPLSGEPIKPDAKVEQDGKTVYFCCNNCAKKYKADPAKYAAKLEQATTHQVHCPVSGKAIDPEVSVEQNGKTVYFCCKGCAGKFKDDPAKFADAAAPDMGVLAYGKTAKDDIVMCPVCASEKMGTKRSEAKQVIHDGKAYYACTADCVTEFKKDPAKYIKALAEAMKPAPGVKSGEKKE